MRATMPSEPLKRGPKPKPQTEQRKPRSVRLNDERAAKLKRLGPAWLEQAIDEATCLDA
jgi:hypothetical protein